MKAGRLHQGRHDQRQGGLRRRPRPRHRALRQGAGPRRSPATTRSTRTRPTTARSPRRPRPPAPTASCTRASPPTTRSSSSRTSRPPSARTRSSTARTASARPASSPRRTAASPPSLDPQVKCTVATLTPDQYPPEGQEFFKAFTEKYGVDNPDPYAIYGYEAMSLALDAIERSKTGDEGRRHEGPLRHQGPRERARHLLDRRERRHDAHRLRRLRRRERRAEVRPGHQGAGG